MTRVLTAKEPTDICELTRRAMIASGIPRKSSDHVGCEVHSGQATFTVDGKEIAVDHLQVTDHSAFGNKNGRVGICAFNALNLPVFTREHPKPSPPPLPPTYERYEPRV